MRRPSRQESRGDSYLATFERNGYRAQCACSPAKGNRPLRGCILLGGASGILVHGLSGANLRLETSEIDVELVQIRPPQTGG